MPFPCGNAEDIVNIAKLCSRIILESGGETYRAEETALRICKAYGFEETDVFATPTGVFISVSTFGNNIVTAIKRIHKRSADLAAIDAVNDVARRLTAGTISHTDALAALRAICARKPPRRLYTIAAAGLTSGLMAMLFKGDIFDFLAAAICGVLVETVAGLIKSVDAYNFSISILGGFIIGLGAVLFVRLTGAGHLDKIITGAIMPLLPGIQMTSAIRDTMNGDLLSGVSRGAEALLVAVALAFGVGVMLKLYLQFIA